jgi:DNA repair exonuclease SbcCD ATPase subunit
MSIGEMKLDLDNRGTVLVLGENSDGAGFERNGAGKSAIFEALVWCLFGRTVRNVAAADVIRRGSPDCLVDVKFTTDGDPVEIRRKRKGAKTSLSILYNGFMYQGKEAQKYIAFALGVDEITFINLVLLSAEYKKLFALASDAERKEILWGLISKMDFTAIRDEVNAQIAAISTEISDLTSDIDKLEFKLSTYTDSIVYLEEGISDREDTLGCSDPVIQSAETDVKCIQDVVDDLVDTISRKKKVQIETEDAARSLLAKLQSTKEALENTAASDMKNFITEASLAKTHISDATVRVHGLQHNIAEAKKLIAAGKCPTCKQSTDGCDTLENEVMAWVLKLPEAQAAVVLATEYFDDVTARMTAYEEQANTRIADTSNQIAACLLTLSSTSSAASGYEDTLAKEQRRLVEAKSALATVTERIRLLQEELGKEKKELETLTTARTAALKDVKTKDKLLTIKTNKLHQLKFWSKGFSPRGVPSLLIEIALPQLNTHIQKYADELTGGTISVALEAYQETSSGTVKEAIKVNALNTAGSSTYGGDSVGERRRIDLAVMLGLIEFFKAVGAFSCNIVAIDEVLDNMDATGVEEAFRVLNSIGMGSSFVVSHDVSLKSLFGTTITVVKNGGVSAIKESCDV